MELGDFVRVTRIGTEKTLNGQLIDYDDTFIWILKDGSEYVFECCRVRLEKLSKLEIELT